MSNKRRKRQNKAQEELISSQFEKLNQIQPEITGKLASDDLEETKTGYEQLMSLVKPAKEMISEAQSKKREKKMHSKTSLNSAITKEESHIYQQIAEHRPKMSMMKVNEFQNYYVWKEKILNDMNGSMSDLKSKYEIMCQFKEDPKSGKGKIQQFKAQTKAFPIVEVLAYDEDYPEEHLQLNFKYELDQRIFNPSNITTSSSGFHREILGSLSALEGQQKYSQRPYMSSLLSSSSPAPQLQMQLKKAEKAMALEFLGMCRTGKDIRAEYSNGEELKRMRQAYIVHVMDYICQDRDRVFTNDKIAYDEKNKNRVTVDNVFEIAAKEEEVSENEEPVESEQDGDSEEGEDELSEAENITEEPIKHSDMLRTAKRQEVSSRLDHNSKDQGFTRPKVLILTPFKYMAYQIIEMIILLTNDGKWKRVSKRKKFRHDYGNDEDTFSDDFKIGISIKHSMKTQTSQLRLYEHFYQSDIIVASPLAVRLMTGQETDETAAKDMKIDFDFLSSIEFLVLDQAEGFVFQNPEHVEELFKVINKTPKKLSDLNDITRLRDIYTQESPKMPKFIRQNIIIQKFKNTDMEFIYDQYCNSNILGSIKLPKIQPNRALEICRDKHIKFTLRRLPNVSSFEHIDASRFQFFTKRIWDALYEENQGYTVLFIPSYFDFVKIRTFLKNKNAQVTFISEYSDKKHCQRSRHLYEQGIKPILVITERAIVFQKIRIRYARNVVLYGLPESPDTLTDCLGELFNSDNWKPLLKTRLNQVKMHKEKSHDQKLQETRALLQEKHTEKSLVGLFSKYDKHALERAVGSVQFKKMIGIEAKDAFHFE